jgi:hypothetical protein
MTANDRQTTVISAVVRLANIETWMRRTSVVALVSANLLGLMTFTSAYSAYEYTRVRSAVAEAHAHISKALEEIRAAQDRKASADVRDAKAQLEELTANSRAALEKTASEMRAQYERNAMTFDLETKRKFIKFYEDTAKKVASDRVQQEQP